MNAARPTTAGASPDRVVRHTGLDRLLHWSTAAAVLVLLGTAFLPILGLEFAWVAVHWWTGIVLAALVLIHVVRALGWQRLRDVLIDRDDLADAAQIVRTTFRLRGGAVRRPGKYSFAQKLIHLAFTIVVLAAIATGGLMLVRIDTPWWQRDPYWLDSATWGIIYVVHGLSALLLVTMIMCHVYFALRPEKLAFTRSMLRGWITREEYARQHDPGRWRVGQ